MNFSNFSKKFNLNISVSLLDAQWHSMLALQTLQIKRESLHWRPHCPKYNSTANISVGDFDTITVAANI